MSNRRSGTDKLTSPQAMLDENQSHGEDKIFEDNPLQISSHSSVSQSSIQDKKELNSGNIQQKQQQLKEKLTESYAHDFYQNLLKPIAVSFIKCSLWFLFVYCLLKIFWVYEDILLRKQSEEYYLKNIMIQKLTDVKKEYQHTFTFLDQVKELLQCQRNDEQNSTLLNKTCQYYSGKYDCMNFTFSNYDSKIISSSANSSSFRYFLQSIESNYQLLKMQIESLIAHIGATNIFLVNLNSYSVIEFNLTSILLNSDVEFILEEGKQQYIQEMSISTHRLQSSHINLFLNYIYQLNSTNSNSSSTDEPLFSSYLNISDSSQQKYQLYELYLYYNQSTTGQQLISSAQTVLGYQSMFNLYCLNLYPSYLSVSFNSKLCVAIKESNATQFSNILYANNKFMKILLTDSEVISTFQSSSSYINVYTLLQDFILSQVNILYPQYSMHQSAIQDCLKFSEQFYESFLDDEVQNLEILRCYCTTYMHMLVSKYIFSWARLVPDTYSYHNLIPVAMLNDTQQFEIQFYYLSNLTYYSDIHNISRSGIDAIQLTIKIYLIILILALFAFQYSTNILQNIMINSIFTLKRLSKVVLSLDDVKKTQTQFKKILKQIEQNHSIPYTSILGVLIGYLQKFLWIKKLYHHNRKFPEHKTKKNRLLFEGLNLFKYLNNGQFPFSKQNESKRQQNSRKPSNINKVKLQGHEMQQASQMTDIIIKSNYSRHPGTLIYIYRELIYLEKEKIDKFKNIQILTKRKNEKARSSQINILQEIDEHRANDSKFGFNNSSRFNYEEDSRGKNSKQVEYQHIFGQQIPQISIMDSKPRQNRGVRFSNQIQLRGFNADNSQKKSKFRQHILSNSSIGKKGSLKSVKSIQSEMKRKIQESQKQERSEDSSGILSSSKKMKRQTTIKNILRGDESVHEGLKTMKFDENSNIYDKQSMLNKSSMAYDSLQGEISIDQFYYTQKQALQQTLESYERMIHNFEQVVQIEECSLQKQRKQRAISYEDEQKRANHIYGIELKRLKVAYQYLQLLIDQQIDKQLQIDFQELGMTASYQHFQYYELNYEINAQLLEEAQVYKMKVDIALGKSISYKKLQEIIDSEQPHVALEATLLYAQQLHKLKPFFDYEVINTVQNSLLLYETSISYKQQSLQLIIDTLQSNPTRFAQQIYELKSIKKYYNRRHKKFYFIADMSESFDIFTPILTKIYELMGKMDLMELYNLAMNQNTQDMQLVRQIIKPQTSQAFLSLFEQLTLQTSKSKEKNSSKFIHKKYVYEKDFNQILDQIEKDQTEFSSFVIVILGGDQISNHSSMMDDADSSSNQRQLNQLLHSQINRKISQNYYHIITIGTYLNNFLTKQGKLKKHLKNSPDLLQIDIIKTNLHQHFSQLQKYLQ